MARPGTRFKILKVIRDAAHRYDRLRTLGIAVSMLILFAVPLSGLARVDLWSGRHALMFEPAPLRYGLAGVVTGITVLYVVTFLSNVVAGRLFCGWGCPVAQVNRLAEVADTPRIDARRRRLAAVKSTAFGALFVLSMMLWWVDVRVLWQGSFRAQAWAWGLLLLGAAWAYGHGRWWRWSFCESTCPIGLYYSFMAPATFYGVHFRNAEESCIECDACDNVCPVDLAPRDLMTPIPARAGLAVSQAPGRNHCLECGDCIRACEWMMARKGEGPVPLLLGYFSGPQRIEAVSPGLPAPALPSRPAASE